jgi:hypothetical protein
LVPPEHEGHLHCSHASTQSNERQAPRNLEDEGREEPKIGQGCLGQVQCRADDFLQRRLLAARWWPGSAHRVWRSAALQAASEIAVRDL